MTVDESIVDRDTMIATLEELGHTYMKFQHAEDAEHVFGIILRTGRDKFPNACTFHRTMFRASMVMKTVKSSIQDYASVTKYNELAQYHQNAAIDAVKIESICSKLAERSESEEYDNSSDDISPASSAMSTTTSDSDIYLVK